MMEGKPKEMQILLIDCFNSLSKIFYLVSLEVCHKSDLLCVITYPLTPKVKPLIRV